MKKYLASMFLLCTLLVPALAMAQEVVEQATIETYQPLPEHIRTELYQNIQGRYKGLSQEQLLNYRKMAVRMLQKAKGRNDLEMVERFEIEVSVIDALLP